MNRRTLLTLLSILVLASTVVTAGWIGLLFMSSRPVAAESVLGVSTASASQSSLLPYPVKVTEAKNPFVQARHYALYSPQSGKTLLAADEETPVPIASTTKLMTAYIVSTRGNLDDVVTISQEAANQPGSIMGARVNEKLTVRSLLLGALLVSGNDCAMALAEYGGGVLLNNPGAPREERIARFVAEMNSEAHKLNMEHTAYLDPAGLNDEGHSSALDLAKLAHFVLIQPVIKEMIPLANTTVTNVSGTIRHDLRNSNRLVADYNYVGIIGGKTGFTPSAGHCLITAAERDGLQLIAVVLNTYAETKEASAQEARKMLDWGFANWKLQ